MIDAISLQGPLGEYKVERPRAEDDQIRVVHGDMTLHWSVEVFGEKKACGLTLGTKTLWGDVFWYELDLTRPAKIDLYGDRVLIRTDHEVGQ